MIEFLLGIIAGVMLTLVLVINGGWVSQHIDLKEECEASLARDKHCVVLFIPEEGAL